MLGTFDMKNTYKLLGLSCIVLAVSACQSTPRQYNGNVGYQIEHQSASNATLAYTLAARKNQQLDENKLQRACQKVLGSQKNYKLAILSINEIPNTAADVPEYGRQIGQTRATFGLSNTPDLHQGENFATRESLEARPSTLHVVRYTCS